MTDDDGTLNPQATDGSPSTQEGAGVTQGVLAGPPVDQQLIQAKDHRWQRWFFYCLLAGFSSAFFALFFCVIAKAAFHALSWSAVTDPDKAAEQLAALGGALSTFPPTTTAILGAVIASIVAIPLSLCVALGKLLKGEVDASAADNSTFTSALFELGRAFAQGWKSLKS